MSTERATETPTARTSTTARLSAVTKTVVVAYTDGAASETALRVAGFEAALRNTSLTVVHQLVGPEAPEVFGAATGSDGARHAATARVAEIVAAAAPNCKTEIRVVTRLIADELIESSRTASLVVVGATVAHPSTAVLFDSVSRAVTRRALCPTLLVHADATHDAGAAVVCGVDRSPASEAALRWAVREAELRGTTVIAVEVGNSARERASEDADVHVPLATWVRLRTQHDSSAVKCVSEHGKPAQRLLDVAASERGLLVIGAHHHHQDHWARSVARIITAQTQVSVVIVPHLA